MKKTLYALLSTLTLTIIISACNKKNDSLRQGQPNVTKFSSMDSLGLDPDSIGYYHNDALAWIYTQFVNDPSILGHLANQVFPDSLTMADSIKSTVNKELAIYFSNFYAQRGINRGYSAIYNDLMTINYTTVPSAYNNQNFLSGMSQINNVILNGGSQGQIQSSITGIVSNVLPTLPSNERSAFNAYGLVAISSNLYWTENSNFWLQNITLPNLHYHQGLATYNLFWMQIVNAVLSIDLRPTAADAMGCLSGFEEGCAASAGHALGL